jgi:hypothetical protein
MYAKLKLKLAALLILACLASILPLTGKASSTVPGDIDGDNDVDINDVVLAVSQYCLKPSDPRYNSTIVEMADLAPPYGIINIFDLITIVYHYTS